MPRKARQKPTPQVIEHFLIGDTITWRDADYDNRQWLEGLRELNGPGPFTVIHTQILNAGGFLGNQQKLYVGTKDEKTGAIIPIETIFSAYWFKKTTA